MKLRKRLDSRN